MQQEIQGNFNDIIEIRLHKKHVSEIYEHHLNGQQLSVPKQSNKYCVDMFLGMIENDKMFSLPSE